MNFEEDAIYAGCDRGTGQNRDELWLSSADSGTFIVGPGGRKLNGMGGVKTTGANLRMMESERMSTTRLL